MAVQMVCPFCKKEFPYNNGKLDAEISAIGQRIQTVTKKLTDIKYGRHDDESWYEKKRLVKELTRLQERITELKAIRKVADQQIKYHEHQLLKDIVKERYGEEEYRKILEKVDEGMKAYKLSDMMKHEYTRAPSKPGVTNIDKL